MATLYIIGNGFDRYHGLLTAYEDFKKHAETNTKHGADLLECFYSPESLWSEFEKCLANPNYNALLKRCEIEMSRLPNDATKEDAWHNVCHEISAEVQWLFSDWINSLDIKTEKKLNLTYDAQFLVFNYTHVLEDVYNIDSSQICYIHDDYENYIPIDIGSGIINTKRYIVGADKNLIDNSFNQSDLFDANLMQIYRRYISKDVYAIMETPKWKTFISKLSDNISSIYVLGHSASPVDQPYFEEINRCLPKAKWFYAEREYGCEDGVKCNLNKIRIQAESVLYSNIAVNDI